MNALERVLSKEPGEGPPKLSKQFNRQFCGFHAVAVHVNAVYISFFKHEIDLQSKQRFRQVNGYVFF